MESEIYLNYYQNNQKKPNSENVFNIYCVLVIIRELYLN